MKWGTGMLSSKEEKLSKNSGTEIGRKFSNLYIVISLALSSPSHSCNVVAQSVWSTDDNGGDDKGGEKRELNFGSAY